MKTDNKLKKKAKPKFRVSATYLQVHSYDASKSQSDISTN